MKNLFDKAFSLLIIIFFSWLYIIVGLVVLYNIGFPIFFKAKRVGKNNKVFEIYKFRTMNANTHIATNKSMQFLRKTNLDEFPQFFNVLLGQMSVVGPRPHDLDEDILFESKIDNYNIRKSVKPGITGLSAIKGNRGGTEISFIKERVAYDLEYIKKQNFIYDVKIILKTIKTIFYPNH
tara:strand:+ start:1897 stop:2433 length:537 start_codon:yes stop_codon:yes gene_type:complete